jgi:hypothetical protein
MSPKISKLAAIALLALVGASPAAAQRLGARTTSPEAMVAQMDQGSPDEEMRRMIAAAEAHPLGTVQNPVRVAGPEGERAYLGRLRCANGSNAAIGPRSNAGVGAFGSMVAAYDVTCGGERHRVVFDMYQEENVETRAPAGFSLAG